MERETSDRSAVHQYRLPIEGEVPTCPNLARLRALTAAYKHIYIKAYTLAHTLSPETPTITTDTNCLSDVQKGDRFIEYSYLYMHTAKIRLSTYIYSHNRRSHLQNFKTL